MIGPDWSGPERTPPRRAEERSGARRIAVVTGSRAEFGLLRPVMHAINERSDLELLVVAAGSHLIQPGLTFRDVKSEFEVADSVPMQTAGRWGYDADVESLAKGVGRFGRSFSRLNPDWVVVLGDRIEAFAAACAASVGGRALAHVHGGDRAEGVADESMRHAITKLAHLHLPATEVSGERIRGLGEAEERIRVVGSPAIDGLESIPALDDSTFVELGQPDVVVLMHPTGNHLEGEEHAATLVLEAIGARRILALDPNHDPGREGVERALELREAITRRAHLPRDTFVGLLRRLGESGGILVGNSSAGLIECGALGCPAVNVGPRQTGREHGENVVHAPADQEAEIGRAIERALSLRGPFEHPFGDGRAGSRIADALSSVDPHAKGFTRKLCTY